MKDLWDSRRLAATSGPEVSAIIYELPDNRVLVFKYKLVTYYIEAHARSRYDWHEKFVDRLSDDENENAF